MFGIPLRLIALLAGAVALVGMVHGLVYQLKEAGRDECRAETAEAARMAELRARERGSTAATRFERDRRDTQARERAIAPAVAAAVASAARVDCIDDRMRDILADDIRQRGDTGEPAPAVPAASRPGRQ